MLEQFKIKTARQYNDLMADRDSLLTKCQGLENEVTNLKGMSVEMTNKQIEHDSVIAQLKADSEKAIETLKADYEKQISELKTKVTEEAGSSETKAIQTLAKIGIPADCLPRVECVLTPKECYDKWQSLRATDANEAKVFYNINASVIKQHVGYRG